MSENKRLARATVIGYVLALAIFLIDQISKYWIITLLQLPQRGQIELMSILNFTWVENRGVSLGMLTASSDMQRWLLVGLTGAISLGVVIWIWREKRTQDVLALGLVLGGAIGNLVDRVRYGYVADFIDLHFGDFQPFLVFNVADAAITMGVVILVLRAFLLRDKPEPAETE
ncbi:signal peptidase II [Parasphingopyxis lamellibrachiae]|uniref:Lipoprotein signal peptidase n=1 Tax=Parasphingopyxis lamellibrachiae TaxID=680125 RepID=A0A3D9FF83_9SPHN|nr:signal peptidase II [Parasphingopyxis lamellibrachiae]RED16237.1 signal peptidase II [Parasphingopyxis lamellibrachiae]